jgi:hypothetical protein
MAAPAFDPGGFFEFSLASGAARTRDGQRIIIMSDGALANLVAGAVERGDVTAFRQLGKQVGESVSQSLGRPPSQLSPEEVLGAASSALALFGWGKLSLERWGDALVAIVSNMPDLNDSQLGVAALLGGMFSYLMDDDVITLPADQNQLGRFILLSPAVAEQVWEWYTNGDTLESIVRRLGPSAKL